MFRYTCLNSISEIGLKMFSDDYKQTNTIEESEAILVRSEDMKNFQLHDSLHVIARAGAGVNNIPLDRCSQAGIVVFNTPGANANGVKELVLTGLLLSSRDIIGGINWLAKEKDNPTIAELTEKQKKQFAGSEIKDKKLGVIGLGAVGVLAANAAIHLGMKVYGYDPYISVDAAWNLDKEITRITDVNYIYKNCDYITLHVPLVSDTKYMINKDTMALMKKGVVVLNYARDMLVKDEDMIEALRSGKVKRYLSDFPDNVILDAPNAIVTPHLGASTGESEDNCAIMAVEEIINFLENGNIKNSVNYPECDMGKCVTAGRILILHKNVKNMISQFSKMLGDSDVNIGNMLNKSRGEYACSLFDLDTPVSAEAVKKINEINGVLKVRVIK
jgi:D-3-phosphoglycerate dehydrogenase